MLPESSASSSPVPAAFVGGRAGPVSPILDFEDGGAGIGDTTGGLMFQTWQLRVAGGNIYLSAPNTPEFAVYTGAATEASFTFDQNMRLVLAYREGGVAKLRWYDATLGADATIELGNVITPRVSLDDKRASQSSESDVILMYSRAGGVFMRIQRERFTIEHTLQASGAPRGLVKIGMLANWRFGWLAA